MFKFIFIFFVIFFQTAVSIQARDFYQEGKKAFGSKSYSRADELFQQALRQNPENGNPYFYRGYMKEYQQKNEEAIEFYKAGISLRMDADLKEKSFWKIVLYYKYHQDWKNLSVYCEKFLRFKKIPDIEKLKNTADENLKKGAPKEQRLAESGIKKLRDGDYEGAREDLTESLTIAPENEPSLWNLALLEMKENNIQNAVRLFKKLTEIKPESWEYHYKLGICYLRLERYEDSIGEMELSLKLNTNPGDTFNHFISLSEGLAYIELNRLEQAEKMLEKSIGIKESSIGLGALARCRYLQNRKDDALSLTKKSLAGDPAQKDALITLSLLEYEKSHQDIAYNLLVQYASEIGKDKNAGIPAAGKKALLLLLALSTANNNYGSYTDSILNQIKSDTAEKLLEEKPYLSIPDADEPARSNRNYQIEDYHYYAGKYYHSIHDNASASEHLMHLKNRSDSFYILAKIKAESGDSKETKSYLQMALNRNPSLKEKIKEEEIFRKLSQSSPEFKDYFQSLFPPEIPQSPRN